MAATKTAATKTSAARYLPEDHGLDSLRTAPTGAAAARFLPTPPKQSSITDTRGVPVMLVGEHLGDVHRPAVGGEVADLGAAYAVP